jgi:uncharacterized protein
MNTYTRTIEKQVKEDLFKGKIVIVYGPRQVGKTTLVRKLMHEYEGVSVYFDCQVLSVHSFLVSDPVQIKNRIGDATLVVLDEAQYVPEIGRVLKTFHDAYPRVQMVVTGSSSFDLASKTAESLAGRTREYTMFPLSFAELVTEHGVHAVDTQIDSLLRFGSYPGIVGRREVDMARDLETLQAAVLYKDVLALDGVNKPRLLTDLIKALALQVGSEVSNSSLANLLDTSSTTIARYVDILEKMFIIKRLYSLSRNPRVEIRKGYKIYFLDLGIRNSVIQNHNTLDLRTDAGALFENFFVIERLKYLKNNSIGANMYFWRTKDQKEIDSVEEREGSLFPYECSYTQKSVARANILFAHLYANARPVQNVTRATYTQFLL